MKIFELIFNAIPFYAFNAVEHRDIVFLVQHRHKFAHKNPDELPIESLEIILESFKERIGRIQNNAFLVAENTIGWFIMDCMLFYN